MSESLFFMPKTEPEPETMPAPEVVETSLEIAEASFNLAPVKDQILLFQGAVENLGIEARALVVHDEKTKSRAVSLAGMAKGKWQEIEKVRNQWLAPHRTFTTSVNNLAKMFQDPLKGIETLLKKKITEQTNRERIELAKKQAEIREQTRLLQESVKAEAELQNIPAPVIVEPVLPDAPAPTRTEEGTASSVKTWTFEITDESLIPREYLLVDEKKIRQAVKAGIREIPGVRIEEKYDTRLRTV